MPQQNLGEEKHLIDHPDECPGVSEVFFSLLCADKQNSADDAAACFVKDYDGGSEWVSLGLKCEIGGRLGLPACEFIYWAHAI